MAEEVNNLPPKDVRARIAAELAAAGLGAQAVMVFFGLAAPGEFDHLLAGGGGSEITDTGNILND